MANVLYDPAREAFLNGEVDWSDDDIKVFLLDSSYTFSAAHDALGDIDGGARLATSDNLSGKTTTDGVADASDVTFAAVPAGDTITQVVVFKDEGFGAGVPLVYIDTLADTNPISIATNDGDIVLRWSNGSDRIFKL